MGSEQLSRDDAAATPIAGLLSDRKVEELLGNIHRSVANFQFYPPNHPLLQEALQEGYRAWRDLEGDHRLEAVGLRLKNGALWLGSSSLGLSNPGVLSLARTLSSHGVVTLVRKQSLSREGFSSLISLLAATPSDLAAEDGIVGAWSRTGFSDAVSLQTLKVAVAAGAPKTETASTHAADGWGAGLSHSGAVATLADPALLSRFKAFQQRGPQERRLLDLLLRLSRTDDIVRFLDLLREISRITQDYAAVERFREAFQVVLFLYREGQNMDALGQGAKRDHLLDTLRIIVRGPFLQWMIGLVTSSHGHEEAEISEHILQTLGRSAVVPLINALIAEKDRLGRRRLVDVLVSIGEPAVPFAMRMLDDQRWFVVRNMITVLGGVGSPEAVRAIGRLARDSDNRIRREVARALARIPGPEAQRLILAFLGDPDASVRLMAASAASGHRTDEVLRALLAAYERIGVRSPEWNLKASLIQAVGRLGMPEATESLAKILRKKPWLRRRRWEALHVAAAQALGELGGEKATEVLRRLDGHWSRDVRATAARALASLGEAGKPGAA